MPQPIWLSDDLRVEGDAHDEGRAGGLLERLAEIVDDHVGEPSGRVLARHDRRDAATCLKSSANPARVSRVSALSFQTSMRVILPSCTTKWSTSRPPSMGAPSGRQPYKLPMLLTMVSAAAAPATTSLPLKRFFTQAYLLH
jgi:hypothetical protein